MNTQQRAQRAMLVPIFTIPDMSVKTRLLVGAILGECGTEVIDNKVFSVAYMGRGSEVSCLVFRPLKHGPTMEDS